MTNDELAHELVLQMIRTRRAYRQAVQRKLRQHNIDMTFEMLQIIYRLWQQQGISQQRLAELTSKDKASLTNLINNLTKKGWVTRRSCTADRRNRLIYLTTEGATLSGVVKPLLHTIYEQAGALLPVDQMQVCTECLNSLNRIFDEM